MKKMIVYTVLFIVVAFVVISALSSKGSDNTVAPDQNGLVKIKLADVSDGLAHYYTVKMEGKDVTFFVLKSKDGVVRSAFNACDVCYPEKKGYRHEGDEMVCNNCNQRFANERINEVSGGCNPSPLARTTEGEFLVIRAEDIAKGAFYF